MNDVRILTLVPVFTFFVVGMLLAKAFHFSYAYVLWPSGVLAIIWIAFVVIATIYDKMES